MVCHFCVRLFIYKVLLLVITDEAGTPTWLPHRLRVKLHFIYLDMNTTFSKIIHERGNKAWSRAS